MRAEAPLRAAWKRRRADGGDPADVARAWLPEEDGVLTVRPQAQVGWTVAAGRLLRASNLDEFQPQPLLGVPCVWARTPSELQVCGLDRAATQVHGGGPGLAAGTGS